jgi:hypothetical protein
MFQWVAEKLKNDYGRPERPQICQAVPVRHTVTAADAARRETRAFGIERPTDAWT